MLVTLGPRSDFPQFGKRYPYVASIIDNWVQVKSKPNYSWTLHLAIFGSRGLGLLTTLQSYFDCCKLASSVVL